MKHLKHFLSETLEFILSLKISLLQTEKLNFSEVRYFMNKLKTNKN
jgi:hypothetical protein